MRLLRFYMHRRCGLDSQLAPWLGYQTSQIMLMLAHQTLFYDICDQLVLDQLNHGFITIHFNRVSHH